MQIFRYVPASKFACPPDRPYRCEKLPQGSRGFYVRAERGSLPPRASDMLTARRQAIGGAGTCTPLDCGLVGCSFSVDPSFLVDVSITFVQLTPRRSPFRYAALATSPYIRSGRSPYQDPSCSSARAQGSKVGWDPSKPRHIAAHVFADHTSTLESVMFLSSSLSVSLITPSEQRL